MTSKLYLSDKSLIVSLFLFTLQLLSSSFVIAQEVALSCDLGPTSISYPSEEFCLGDNGIIQFSVKNFSEEVTCGSYETHVTVYRGESTVFSEIVSGINLDPGEERSHFTTNQFIPETTGSYYVQVWTNALSPHDINSSNDSQGHGFDVITCNGSISGIKFQDNNGNGDYDDGEPLLAGWKIKLDGFITLTNSQGYYSFSEVEVGSHTVEEILQEGYQQTLPGGSEKYTVNVASGENVTGIDFGNMPLGSIMGYKYQDNNGNGEYDDGEPYLSGWTIQLNSGEAETVTGVDGAYYFENLTPDTYSVSEVMQEGFTQTYPAGNLHTVNLSVGEEKENINFGNKPDDAIISGKKFRDDNNNGQIDDGEPGLEGWTIKCTGQTSVITDADGNYSFSVPAGDYTISEDEKNGWTQTYPSELTYTLTVSNGEVITDKDFGNYPHDITIQGRKYRDDNGNGQKDAGEPGLSGWTIKCSGQPDAVTDENGEYSFTVPFTAPDNGIPSVEEGYILEEVFQNGWTQTQPDTDYWNIIPGVSVEAGDTINAIDFGNKPGECTIFGQKFLDANNNNQKDEGEIGLAGWTIKCTSQPDATTDENGYYSFCVQMGNYTVEEVQRDGWTQTYPSGGTYSVSVGAGEIVNGKDFGNYPHNLTIQGRKYCDDNGNGRQDIGEPALPGWTIQCTGQPDAVTDVWGNYSFTVPYITAEDEGYIISEVMQDGWTQTDPAAGYYSVTAGAGEIETNKNFGNQPIQCQISGKKWQDNNGDGIIDPAEVGLMDWIINLDGSDYRGNQVHLSQPTDEEGNYSFNDIKSGNYIVSELVVENWIQSFPGEEGVHEVTLGFGESLTNLDFGNIPPPGMITGQKFFDMNNNNYWDLDEIGMDGVWIELWNAGGLVAAQQTHTTDLDGDGIIDPALESGLYAFELLPPAVYTVKEIVPAGWIQTYPVNSNGTHEIILQPNTVAYANFGDYIEGMDFGDLPDPLDPQGSCIFWQCYPTQLPIGARHPDIGPKLGELRDVEPDGQPATLASGDDSTDVDDEDGVEFITINQERNAEIQITVSGEAVDFPAYLCVWIDLNMDGYLSSTPFSERIFKGEYLQPGIYKHYLPIPVTELSYTYARFRISSDSLSVKYPWGIAKDGEVEDYFIDIINLLTSMDSGYSNEIPDEYQLYQNYPNPFNPSTTVQYDVKKETNVRLEIYNVLGQVVMTLVDNYQSAGKYRVLVDFTEIPSGIYFYTIKMGEYVSTKKMILIR